MFDLKVTMSNKEKDKISWPSWVTAIATIILVIVTALYVHLLYSQNKLQQDPILKINPNKWSIKGKDIGIFDLSIQNTGISDVTNVRIFEDYFIVVKNEYLTLYRIGPYAVTSDQKIDSIDRGEEKTFQINFSNLMSQIDNIYTSNDMNGTKYRIVKIKTKFEREIDKKEFSFDTFYVIAGHGDMLLSKDQRNTSPQEFAAPWVQIEEILGN